MIEYNYIQSLLIPGEMNTPLHDNRFWFCGDTLPLNFHYIYSILKKARL